MRTDGRGGTFFEVQGPHPNKVGDKLRRCRTRAYIDNFMSL